VERWAEQLSRSNLRLGEYDELAISPCQSSMAISATTSGMGKATSTSQNLDLNGLKRERKDLVQIIALMIRNAMVMVKEYNDDPASSSPVEETSTMSEYLTLIAGEQSTAATQSDPAPNSPTHLPHINHSGRDVFGTRASPINTLYESIDTRPSVSLSPVSPLEHFSHTANVVADKNFVVHRDETIKSAESASLRESTEIEDSDESMEEYYVGPSYEYLHMGPDSLYRTDVEGGWRVM
jgi:hypothetical protein